MNIKKGSRDFKFLFNGEQPQFLVNYGFDGLNEPWFTCLVDGEIDDIDEFIEGTAQIEGTSLRANVTMRVSIEFEIESAVTKTYRTYLLSR